jgi:membrane-associated protease RseP (regulator of RpoE activity)
MTVLVQIFAIFVMLGILSILIIVHECGHFSVARFFGFQTPVFGFGLPFGPHWVVGKKWGTEFRIHACLLGGYVAIPELGDESNQDAFGVPLKPFKKFPIWQRALVAFAGVGFNILFAYLVTIVMFFAVGEPVQTVAVAAMPKENPIAAQAGVKVGDELISVDDCKVGTPSEAVDYLSAHKRTPVKVHVLRDKQPLTIEMTTNEYGKVGMALEAKQLTYKKVQGNFLDVAVSAFRELCRQTAGMLSALGQMVQGLAAGGKASAGHPAVGIQDLHGVLAVVKIGADIAQQDWSQLFLFTILISMDLAIINLVPWPALDGGHLAFMFFEAVRGKPMGERAHGEIVKWGFLGLMVLMVVIMANDVTALVSGKLDYKKKDTDQSSKETKPEAKTEDANSDTSAQAGQSENKDGESRDVDNKDAESKDAK